MPASEQSKHAARQGVQKSAQYLPPYAAHALQNLPPCIKKVLPTADPRHMEFSELPPEDQHNQKEFPEAVVHRDMSLSLVTLGLGPQHRL